eukprot:11201365-Lingulodinium_polyedra.AAC.1
MCVARVFGKFSVSVTELFRAPPNTTAPKPVNPGQADDPMTSTNKGANGQLPTTGQHIGNPGAAQTQY